VLEGVFVSNFNRLMNCSLSCKGQIVQCRSCGRRQVMRRRKHFSWMMFSMFMGWFYSFPLLCANIL